MSVNFQGVFAAITTPFKKDGSVDHKGLAALCQRMVKGGCIGIIPTGSLGESATLTFDEKVEIYKTCVKAVKVSIVPGIASLSTAEAVALAKAAEKAGCQGLMVLPPYVYSTDWREMKAHVAAVIGATKLSCLLYNNPIAYKTDFLPEQILELAKEHKNLLAVKESCGDARRVTYVKHTVGDRLTLMVGMDDCIVEGVAAGATGWVAGLVNAFPEESVAIYNYAMAGERKKADDLYKWFLPLLRLDIVPKFVQLIKYTQYKVDGTFPASVRGPRLELEPSEKKYVDGVVKAALAKRPKL
jgi:dihydrodipicolinate synthase/N-acetylneuraminate lyase